MDAVLKEIEGNLGGRLSPRSTPGQGTTLHMEIPKSETLAECILFGDGALVYAIPKVQEVAHVDCDPRHRATLLGATTVHTGGDHCFPVIPSLLAILAHLEPTAYTGRTLHGHTIIRLGVGERQFGLAAPAVFGHRRMKVDRSRGGGAVTGRSELVYGYALKDPVIVVLDVEKLEQLVFESLG